MNTEVSHIPYITEFKQWLMSEGKTASIATEIARLKSIFDKTLLPHEDFAYILKKKIEMAMTGGIAFGLKEIMVDAMALARDDMFNEFKNRDYHANCRSALKSYFKFIAMSIGSLSSKEFAKTWNIYNSFISSLPYEDKCSWAQYDDDTFVSGTFGRFYRHIKIFAKENMGGEIFSEWADADLYCEGEEISSAFSTIKELAPRIFDNKTGDLKLITMIVSDKSYDKTLRELYEKALPFFCRDVNIQVAIYKNMWESLSIRVESI